MFQDKALLWARENQSIARACMSAPLDLTGHLPESSRQSSTRTFEDFWRIRNWNFSNLTYEGEECAKRLVSHVLSAPLTLARFAATAPPSSRTGGSQQRRLCCVGARSEATLPSQFWREVLFTVPQHKGYTVDFVGPDVVSSQPPVDLSWLEKSLRLQWLHTGYLHDLDSRPQWDGFVLFNPGLGHSNLKENWMPTLEYLLESNTPLLFTAHSEQDAERDQRLLNSLTSSAVSYQPNPLASRITYQDPLATARDTQYVRPNQYVCSIPA